ncbi:unnamed protein product [Mytilus coruscus]|uniref:Uncharacterized protein n=1 Tax=Mytilus coruscus TaxID=42192 RepID=A0A6J8ATM5_MYTCO|nr:unnamed protein product [Mytilus coruscus]
MLNNTKVNDSIWVGSFEALLPWIEIRGCYNIPLTCNSLERDEKHAENLQLCQIKCMERRYFAFNKQNERCVCFDEHDVVKKETDNASLCQECIDRGDCNTHATVYKDQSQITWFVIILYDWFLYKQNGMDEELMALHIRISSNIENPVTLCKVSESLTPGIDVWVGVYRQKLYMDNLDKAVLQDFDQIEQYISRCDHLPTNNVLKKAENCSEKHHYICTSDTPIDIQEEPIENTTSNHVCRPEDPYTRKTDNQSSGIIAGTVTSMLVIVAVVVIVVFTYRRFNSKSPKRKDIRSEGEPPKNNMYTKEKNSECQHYAIDMALNPNSFAKPPEANNTKVQKAAEDEKENSRVVSTIVDASNLTKKTTNATANPGYNDLQVKVDTKTNQNEDPQSSNSMANTMKSEDYCLAKPLTYLGEMNSNTDNTDYDHLRSVEHHEKDSVNVYDHVPNIVDSDDTYDHSTINMRESESNNYDHFDVQN